MKASDVLCSKNYAKYKGQKTYKFREHCQHFVSHSFNRLRTLLTEHPAKRNYEEPTRLETNSKLSKTKTYKDRQSWNKISTQNQDWKHTVPRIWERTPKYLKWKSEKNRKGVGDLKQFQQAPILHVWGLSFELRRRMEIRNKLFQKISLNKIT